MAAACLGRPQPSPAPPAPSRAAAAACRGPCACRTAAPPQTSPRAAAPGRSAPCRRPRRRRAPAAQGPAKFQVAARRTAAQGLDQGDAIHSLGAGGAAALLCCDRGPRFRQAALRRFQECSESLPQNLLLGSKTLNPRNGSAAGKLAPTRLTSIRQTANFVVRTTFGWRRSWLQAWHKEAGRCAGAWGPFLHSAHVPAWPLCCVAGKWQKAQQQAGHALLSMLCMLHAPEQRLQLCL